MHLLKINKDGASLAGADEYKGKMNYALVEALLKKYSDKAAVIAVIMFLTLLLFSILQRRIVKGRRYEV